MALPTDLPFWEVRRGKGPVTDWHQDRERLKVQAQERRRRLNDPRTIPDAEHTLLKRRRGSSLSEHQRRERGLCVQCLAPSPTGTWRCQECRDRYNTRPCREKLRKS